LRNLTNYEQRLSLVARHLDKYLIEAGISQDRRSQLLNLYNLTKSLFHSVKVDFTYENIGMGLGPFEMLHVPGHCPGHVVIRLHDVLFSGDHVLDGVSPHQSPEQLTLSTGLEHYLRSLDKVESWAEGVQLTLGGHGEPIKDLSARIESIRQVHKERLAQVLDLLVEPRTVADIADALFGEVHGYNILLALEEAGAHVEYLYQRGLLGIANVTDLESREGLIPIQYFQIPGEE
jgi:glyoxylase-like metal-dependent hydrolase (beta-lactamase superfamily II)